MSARVAQAPQRRVDDAGAEAVAREQVARGDAVLPGVVERVGHAGAQPPRSNAQKSATRTKTARSQVRVRRMPGGHGRESGTAPEADATRAAGSAPAAAGRGPVL